MIFKKQPKANRSHEQCNINMPQIFNVKLLLTNYYPFIYETFQICNIYHFKLFINTYHHHHHPTLIIFGSIWNKSEHLLLCHFGAYHSSKILVHCRDLRRWHRHEVKKCKLLLRRKGSKGSQSMYKGFLHYTWNYIKLCHKPKVFNSCRSKFPDVEVDWGV